MTPARKPSSPSGHRAREVWLIQAVEHLRPLLRPDELPPLVIRVDRGMKFGGKPADGLCWDDAPECRIDIALELDEPTVVLAVLLHELIHAAVGPELMHNGAYRPMFDRVGFRGPYVGTLPSCRLQDSLREVARRLGPYPPS